MRVLASIIDEIHTYVEEGEDLFTFGDLHVTVYLPRVSAPAVQVG